MCTSLIGLQRYAIDQKIASVFDGSMSSLTAMQILPQFAISDDAPLRPRQTSVRGVLAAYCTKITGRKLVSGSCITTRLTPRTARWSRRCASHSGSYATFLTRLDSLGVTW